MKRFKYFLGLVLLISVCFTGQGSLAKSPIDHLLNSSYRPTMTEIYQAYGQRWPTDLELQEIHPNMKNILQKFKITSSHLDLIANSIAALEFAYPGATYASLGRDAELISDLLEVFYLNMGIPNRVHRIYASTSTFSSATEAQLTKLLQSSGLDLSKSSPGYVIIDRTSLSESSQSTRLLHTIFKRATNHPQSQRYNLFGVVSTVSGNRVQDLKGSLAQHYRGDSAKGNPPSHPIHIPELAAFTDHITWNAYPFGSIISTPEGFSRGQNSALNNLESRLGILVQSISYARMLKSRTFMEKVKTAAANLDYDLFAQLKSNGGVRPEAKPKTESDPLDDWEVTNVLQTKLQDALDQLLNQVKSDTETRSFWLTTVNPLAENEITQFLEKSAKGKSNPSTADVAGAINQWISDLQASAKADWQVIPSTEDGLLRLLLTLAPRQFDVVDTDYYGKSYLSGNATQILQRIQNMFKTPVRSELLITCLQGFEKLYSKKLITERDYRRLVLWVLAVVPDNQFFVDVEILLKKQTLLRKVLAERAEVYLTSERYDMRARKNYLTMVKMNLLPEPDEKLCEGNFKKKAG